MRQLHLSAIVVSAFSFAAWAQPAETTHVSPTTGVSFAIPDDSQVFERDLHVDGGLPEPTTVRLLNVVRKGVSEESSLSGQIEATVQVHRLSSSLSLDTWMSRLCPNAEPEETRTAVTVAGLAAVRREQRDAKNGSAIEVLFVRDQEGYRVAPGPASGGAAVFERILETIAWQEPQRAIQEMAEPDPAHGSPVSSPLLPAALVRVIYLVPSDRTFSEWQRLGVERSIRQVQSQFHGELNEKTFSLHSPVVEAYQTAHTVAWYQTNGSGSANLRFWNNALADGFALTGGRFDDPSNRWIYYLDADPLCGQAVGGTNGVALLPANDLRGVACGRNIQPCSSPDNSPLCRWVGGLGHELGHAFRLPHPTTCPAPDPNCSRALMWTGYTIFPSSYLLASEKSSLLNDPNTGQFFSAVQPAGVSQKCANGCSSVRADAHSAAGTSSNLNGVFEPNEAVSFEPQWSNGGGGLLVLTGTASNFTGPGPAAYSRIDGFADYGKIPGGWTYNCFETTNNCYTFGVAQGGPRPLLHWDATFRETLSTSDLKTWTVHLGESFSDVPHTHPFYRFVETLLHRGITGGCGNGLYCVDDPTSRGAMSVFVLTAREGAGYQPAACTGSQRMFSDVPAGNPYCRWIEELARRGVVSGCGGGRFCPDDPVTREQMPVFVLRTREGASYSPPVCHADWLRFDDVSATSPFCPWVEELARRGVASGCGGGGYCPEAFVTRGEMSVFLVETFALPLYSH